MKIQVMMEVNAVRDLSGLVTILLIRLFGIHGPFHWPLVLFGSSCHLKCHMVRSTIIFLTSKRFNSPETPVHLDSPDTPFIGRRAFYPKPNDNLNDGQSTNSNESGTAGHASLQNDSTAKPSMNKNQQRQRNQFNRQDKEYHQNDQRRQDRHQR